MSERRQFIGLTTGESSQFTGLNREITIDTQAQTVRVHDGYTPGGTPLANASLSNVSQSSINTVLNNFGAEKSANKVTQVSALSTNEQYPSAKLLYQLMQARPVPAVGDLKYSLQGANHNGWLLCNGQAVSRTQYDGLFQLIGTYFGAGDGVTTFNVPNYQGCFMRMTGGDAYGVYNQQPESFPDHRHYLFAQETGVSAYIYDSTEPNTIAAVARHEGGNRDYAVSRPFTKTEPDCALSGIVNSTDVARSTHVTPVNYSCYYFIYGGQ